mgnify:CR=1 FL=1
MKIEKISDNQIRCTLTRADLADRQLKLSELAYGTEKAKVLFRDMMQQAAYEFGFEAEDIPLMIEAIPLSADTIILIITKVEYPEEKMPKLFVDSEKVAWVLTNLLSNAIRYSKENGRVIIGAKQEGNFVELYVQDFGKGIDPRYHQSIFDRYFRVPGTKVQGSGLGLSISKDFIEAHGGTLTVQSELGIGSRFAIRLKA